MMLILPLEEQQHFAEPTWIHFAENTAFNEHQLYKAENYHEKDPRLETEDKGWQTQTLGNLAYMVVNCNEKFRSRWIAVHKAYIERAKYIGSMS